eukprot:m.166908 g.166908  ORF g.166908 m.166908 type:complete len:216 (-) comp21120_c1_seq3:76-723(-)
MNSLGSFRSCLVRRTHVSLPHPALQSARLITISICTGKKLLTKMSKGELAQSRVALLNTYLQDLIKLPDRVSLCELFVAFFTSCRVCGGLKRGCKEPCLRTPISTLLAETTTAAVQPLATTPHAHGLPFQQGLARSVSRTSMDSVLGASSVRSSLSSLNEVGGPMQAAGSAADHQRLSSCASLDPADNGDSGAGIDLPADNKHVVRHVWKVAPCT